jgi:hypothetical protein
VRCSTAQVGGRIHQRFVFACKLYIYNSAVNLDGAPSALNIDTSINPFKPGFGIHLKIEKLEDVSLEFTQIVDPSNIGIQYMQSKSFATSRCI